MQLTHHARWNRYDTAPAWYDLTVIGERPAAYRHTNMRCVMRYSWGVRHCRYYDDCAENCARGGAVLCEAIILCVTSGTLVEM